MKLLYTPILLLIACCWPGTVRAQLQLVTNVEPQRVFFGGAKNISVTLHNLGDKSFEGEIRAQIFQTSPATAVLISENPWKRLQVPAAETILESAALDFPAVRAETKFLVQWLENTNHVLGMTPVL